MILRKKNSILQDYFQFLRKKYVTYFGVTFGLFE